MSVERSRVQFVVPDQDQGEGIRIGDSFFVRRKGGDVGGGLSEVIKNPEGTVPSGCITT